MTEMAALLEVSRKSGDKKVGHVALPKAGVQAASRNEVSPRLPAISDKLYQLRFLKRKEPGFLGNRVKDSSGLLRILFGR